LKKLHQQNALKQVYLSHMPVLVHNIYKITVLKKTRF
jgi:hypothetical protein